VVSHADYDTLIVDEASRVTENRVPHRAVEPDCGLLVG